MSCAIVTTKIARRLSGTLLRPMGVMGPLRSVDTMRAVGTQLHITRAMMQARSAVIDDRAAGIVTAAVGRAIAAVSIIIGVADAA